jgi:uncharacterized protein YjbI with pentapeptide repeats
MDATGVVLLERATISDVDFRRASFERFAPTGCVFVNCDFSGVVFDQRLSALLTGRVQSVFRECRFDGADMRKTGPGQSRFERCSFEETNLERWTSLAGEFVGCTFAGPIHGAKFHGRPHGALASALSPRRSVNEFRDNDFTRADILDTLFIHGIRFDAQRWPAAPGHVRLDRIHQRFQVARLEAMRWPDRDARNDALEFLTKLTTLYGEQAELVRRRYDASLHASRAVQDQIWELLSQPL